MAAALTALEQRVQKIVLRQLTGLASSIGALPPSTPHGVCGTDYFCRLLDKEALSCDYLLEVLEDTWKGTLLARAVPVEDIRLGDEGVGTVLALFEKVGAESLVQKELEEGGSVTEWLSALLQAVDEWWWSRVEGEKTKDSLLVKCIPTGGDWRWNSAEEVRELKDSDRVPRRLNKKDKKLWTEGFIISRQEAVARLGSQADTHGVGG